MLILAIACGEGKKKKWDLSNKSGQYTQRALAQRWQQRHRRETVQAALCHTEASSENNTLCWFVPKLSILAGVSGDAAPQKYPLKAPGVIAGPWNFMPALMWMEEIPAIGLFPWSTSKNNGAEDKTWMKLPPGKVWFCLKTETKCT